MKNLLLLTLICIVTAGSIIGAEARAQNKTCQDIQSQIDHSNSQIADLQGQLNVLNAMGYVSEAKRTKIQTIQDQIDTFSQQIQSLQSLYTQEGCR